MNDIESFKNMVARVAVLTKDYPYPKTEKELYENICEGLINLMNTKVVFPLKAVYIDEKKEVDDNE